MVAAILPLVGWLSSVIVALVCLRHGAKAGAAVLVWVVLPVGVALYYFGDPSSAIALLGTYLMAATLRQTRAWELALTASVVVSALGTLIFQWYAADILEGFVAFYMDYLQQVDANFVLEADQARTLLLGFFAFGQALAMVAMLVLARWCQSAIYNPGGFGEEFRAQRLSPGLSAGLVAVMLLCYVFNEQLGLWLPLLTVPLVVSSLGLVHWWMARKGLSTGWVTMFYISLMFLLQLVYPFLVAMALVDSWFNIRKRLQMNEKD